MNERAGAAARFPTGLIVGRFDPPHLGHSFMIDRAARRCGRLVVFVNSSPARDAIPGGLRATWLGEQHPAVAVREVRHGLRTDFTDPDLWERWIALFRDHWPHEVGPDAVFASDGYVDELAERLGAASVVIDAERSAVPISATMIRRSPADHLDDLAPPVRTWIETNWL